MTEAWFDKYKVCRLCGDPLDPDTAAWALQRRQQKAHMVCLEVEEEAIKKKAASA